MKKLLIVAAICIGGAAAAQDNKTAAMPAPEFMNQVYHYQSQGNTLQALEQGTVSVKTKTKLGGFGGASSMYILDGSRAAVRIPNNEKLSFAIKMSSMMMMDASAMIVLYKFDIKNGGREALLQSSGFRGKNSQQQQGIKCNTKQMANGVYILVPATPLTPGEYGFINTMMPGNYSGSNMSYTVFAFGVD
jgi:hypothetical protein